MKKIYFCFLSFIFLNSCMVGPKIEKPTTHMPKGYNLELKKENSLSLDTWWKDFNDKDLNDFIDMAIVNNYDLKTAFEKIEYSRSLYRIKKADLYPEIDISAVAIRQEISKNLSNTFNSFVGKGDYFQFGFDASWEIDFFGKLRRAKQAAFFSYMQSRYNLVDVYTTLLSDVAKTYVNIIYFKNKIDIAEKKLIFQKDLFNLINKKFASGLSSEIINLEEFKVIQNLKQEVLDLTTFYKNNIHKLAILLGKEPENFYKSFEKDKEIPKISKNIDVGLPSTLLKRRPDIKEAEKLLYEKTASIGVAVAKLFPSFSLIGSFDFESSKSKNWFRWSSKSWSIGPSFDMPLIDFGRRLANIDAAKAEHKQALYQYKNTVLLALEDVENSLVAYFHETQNLSFISKKLDSQEKMTSLKKDLFESGLQSEIDYLKSKIILLNTKSEYLDKQKNVSIDLIALIKAIGGGW